MTRFVCLATFLVMLIVGNAAADVIVLDANTIATVISGPGQNINYGGGPSLIQPSSDNNQGLLGFDLASIKVPVKSATLKVFQDSPGYYDPSGTGIPPPGSYDIYRNTSAWAQNAVTWNTKPSIDPTSVATLPLGVGGVGAWRSWNVTSLVNGWITGKYDNFGLTIGRSDPGTPDVFLVTLPIFYAYPQAEGASAPPPPGTEFPPGTFIVTPELVLDTPHNAPEPTSLLMAGIAVVGLVGWRCRHRPNCGTLA
jgi:PEP-CTERM motif